MSKPTKAAKKFEAPKAAAAQTVAPATAPKAPANGPK